MAMASSASLLLKPSSAAPPAHCIATHSCCRVSAASHHRKRTARVVMASTGQKTAVSEKDVSTSGSRNVATPTSTEPRVVVGCGVAGVDYLARVATFPEPDEKMRSLDLKVQGGGNCGNTITCAARLGLTARLFTKIADDGPGKQILDELQGDGVDTQYVVVAKGGNSPFTYVIIDQNTGTRTCIHTPGIALGASDATPAVLNSLLSGANLVFLDGRFPDAALVLAEEASKRQVPILVDAERKREALDEILSYADYIVASAKFPQAWTDASTLGEALLEMLLRLPRVKFVIVTLGASGCVMLERHSSDVPDGEPSSVNKALESLMKEVEGLEKKDPHVVASKVGILYYESEDGGKKEMKGRLFVGTAVPIPSSELVDTTGAGDAFIGATLYGLLAGMAPEKMLPFSTVVAAANCKAVGARGGMPQLTDAKLASFL